MFSLNINDFKDAGKNNEASSWSDEELLKQIQVLQCLTAYFLARGERIVHFPLQLELTTLEGYASARKWECNNHLWRIRRKDGTLA